MLKQPEGRAPRTVFRCAHFSARLQKALDEARPHREDAAKLSAQAKILEEKIRDQRKEKIAPSELAALDEELKSIQRSARDSLAKAEAVENAAYDLKAVNSNRVRTEDKRTPAQLLESIADKGTEVDAALRRLRTIVA